MAFCADNQIKERIIQINEYLEPALIGRMPEFHDRYSLRTQVTVALQSKLTRRNHIRSDAIHIAMNSFNRRFSLGRLRWTV